MEELGHWPSRRHFDRRRSGSIPYAVASIADRHHPTMCAFPPLVEITRKDRRAPAMCSMEETSQVWSDTLQRAVLVWWAMRGMREITGAIFAALEIVHGIMRTLAIDLVSILQPQPHPVISWVLTASWIAFIAFAANSFRTFSYRWLRVIAAFFAFVSLPVVAVLIFGRYGPSMLSLDWILRLPTILEIASHSIQLGVAGLIYRWSVRRESGSVVAVSADLAT